MDFDATVEQIMRVTGVDRERAVAAARRNGIEPPAPSIEELAKIERDARIREKDEQAAVTKLLREHGFKVRSTSQARASKIAIGFPDLFCTHKVQPIAFFFETKRQVGGVTSDAQRDFAADCWRCGIKWYSGDRFIAQQVLRDCGLEAAT